MGLVRQWPHGNELIVMVDNVLRYGRLYRNDLAALEADRDTKRQQLEAAGWSKA